MRSRLFLVLAACTGGDMPTPSLTLSAKPSAIDDQGEAATVTVKATGADLKPGSGTVTVSAAAGSLKMATSVGLDSMGTGTTTFSCVQTASDAGCFGRVQLRAEWNGVIATTSVRVGDAGFPPPPPDSGNPGSDAGTPDAGRSDAGYFDAGPTDGGGLIDAGFPFVGDRNQLYLLGTLTQSPGALQPAIARLTVPGAPAVGLPVTAAPNLAQLRFDGRLVYLDDGTHQLMMMVTDAYPRVGMGASYPTAPEANDDALPATACDGGNPISAFWLYPDSTDYVYRCGLDLEYFLGPATNLPALRGAYLVSLGFRGTALLSRGTGNDFTLDEDGGMHPLFGLTPQLTVNDRATAQRSREVRALSAGFRVVFGQPPTGLPPCDLWQIAPSGNAAKAWTFANLPAGITAPDSCTGRLDVNGTLYTPAKSGASVDVVVQRPQAPTSATIIYTESTSPSNYSVYPPIVFTFMDPGSSLVTGP